ncbi:MAG: hypothetical protein WDM88_04685 [Galbitalea sp.]
MSLGSPSFGNRAGFDPELWPEDARIEGADIITGEGSLLRLIASPGIPAVHVGGHKAILVTRVLATAVHVSGVPVAQLDVRLDNLRLVWAQARLIGRETRAARRICLAVRRPGDRDIAETTDVLALTLPRDLAAGDLVAIPSRERGRDWTAPLHPLTGRDEGRPHSIFPDGVLDPPLRRELRG